MFTHLLIDWLVFNANISRISAILWREQILKDQYSICAHDLTTFAPIEYYRWIADELVNIKYHWKKENIGFNFLKFV
jgi:hypothetical protein